MAQTHEWMFYEVMWRSWAGRAQVPYPVPWWAQAAMRRWSDDFDAGTYDSKEAAFASNALYRYWGMVGVKDHRQESLIGQAGEIEPVYDKYCLSFFLFDPATGALHLPQLTDGGTVEQRVEAPHLPVVLTRFRTADGVEFVQRTFAVPVGARQRDAVVTRLTVGSPTGRAREGLLCAAVMPAGPSGFQRHDRNGRQITDRRLTFLRYLPGEGRVETNSGWGPVFDTAPDAYGVYGNTEFSTDPDQYVRHSPFHDLVTAGKLNGALEAQDQVAGLCSAVFTWPYRVVEDELLEIDVRLPVDLYSGSDDLAELRATPADELEGNNRDFWSEKLLRQGVQPELPRPVAHLADLFRQARSQLLVLSDLGEIHPGPTVYDSFWIRDSSVEATACSLAGDTALAGHQLGTHYPLRFNRGGGRIGPCAEYGFYGGPHERDDREWDSNGQALWALGRFDRTSGRAAAFGARLYAPYVLDGARWLRDNRDGYGLLHSGWSAEHLGERDKPHYWDDLWGLAGLYEAARLAERIGAPEAGELWGAFDDLKAATAASMRWVLAEQRRRGAWETYLPTGPGDVGRLDSTMIGAAAYFHPLRLHMGNKLGDDIDVAARHTLDTLYAHFVTGGFRHEAAWNAYGPYLTMQLAHAYLLAGNPGRADELLGWVVDAAFPHTQGRTVAPGAWNEQHAFPIASDFAEVPALHWYMGDIPHGWAAAEYLLLLRDILFFEADEDRDPHLYIAPGVRPHWLRDAQPVAVENAPTLFGRPFGYRLTHEAAAKRVRVRIGSAPHGVRFVYPCRFGPVRSAVADGRNLDVGGFGDDVHVPAGTREFTVTYG
ncbi:glucosidase family protein [Streptomyces sp. SGAir0957]